MTATLVLIGALTATLAWLLYMGWRVAAWAWANRSWLFRKVPDYKVAPPLRNAHFVGLHMLDSTPRRRLG